MNNVVILGSGGHARSVAGVAIEALGLPVVAFVDIHSDEDAREKIYGLPVVPGKSNLEQALSHMQAKRLILSVGDNATRKMYFERLRGHFEFPNIISPTAVLKKSVTLGQANVILDQVYIGPECKLGDNNLFNTRALIEHECVVGSHNHFAPASVLLGRVSIGDHNFIGAGATIKQNTYIKNQTMIGANAFVHQSIDEPGLYVGLPVVRKGAVR